MRFMMLMIPLGYETAPPDVQLDPAAAAKMMKYNEELQQAGEGLHPTAKGARISYNGGEPEVTQGPFAFSQDLVAGFWLIDVASRDEAIAWMKRAPFLSGDEIEIRQIYATEDFGDALTPELREQEGRLRKLAAQT